MVAFVATFVALFATAFFAFSLTVSFPIASAFGSSFVAGEVTAGSAGFSFLGFAGATLRASLESALAVAEPDARTSVLVVLVLRLTLSLSIRFLPMFKVGLPIF